MAFLLSPRSSESCGLSFLPVYCGTSFYSSVLKLLLPFMIAYVLDALLLLQRPGYYGLYQELKKGWLFCDKLVKSLKSISRRRVARLFPPMAMKRIV